MARDPEDPRSRSRSPAPASDRLPDIPKDKTKSKTKSSKSSGFRWKEKKDADIDNRHDGEVRTQSRYRERSSSRERKRKRRTDENVVSDVTPMVQPDLDDDIAAKFGPGAAVAVVRTRNTSMSTSGIPQTASATADRKPKTSAKSSIPTGPMIVVKVNDRLGTTSKVPCLASDNIGDFKKLLAMRIGRKPHEIMLKRQGERPFKDMLSLQDYGVSDGVQIDLELDTGD